MSPDKLTRHESPTFRRRGKHQKYEHSVSDPSAIHMEEVEPEEDFSKDEMSVEPEPEPKPKKQATNKIPKKIRQLYNWD